MINASIDTIDNLVLDWIIRCGYLSTFNKLPTSSKLPKGSLIFRAEVGKLIRTGRISEAIKMIESSNLINGESSINGNDHNYKLTTTKNLSTSQPLNLAQILYILRVQEFIELVRQRNTQAALSHVQNVLMKQATEFGDIFGECLGILAYAEPEKSPLNWLFEQPNRYSALAALTNLSLFQLNSSSSPSAPLEVLLKHCKAFDALVQDVEGFGNELNDRKWSEIRNLIQISGNCKNNFVKVVKID